MSKNLKILNMKRIKPFLYLFLAAAAVSCEQENPLDNEQYKKEVYIVGSNQSNNQGLSLVQLPYLQSETEEVPTFISVAVGGSKDTDRDIRVSVEEAGSAALSHYNFLYLFGATDVRYQYLSGSFYRIPETNVTIKAGESYARIPIFIKTAELEADSLYALTFKLSSVSDPDYVSIRKRDSVLMFSVRLNNDFSGTYQLEGSYIKEVPTNPNDLTPFPVSTTRTLKAVNHNTVRFVHTANKETLANAATLGVSVKVNQDNTVELSPWGTFALIDGGGSYDPVQGAFNIWYTFKENNVVYKFTGKYMKSNI